MPLVPAVLQAELYRALSPPYPSDGYVASDRLAKAYDVYASTALAGAYPFTPTGAESGRFVAALAPVLSVTPNTGPAVAASISAAVTAYWTGALFGAGVAAPPLGAPVLLSALTATLSLPSNTTESLVAQLASALDACTRTVVVTVAGPPVATFPIL